MVARIYRPARNAMQQGDANTREWRLDFESETPRTVDPLMGWISNADTNPQVRMSFDTREEAIAFAQRQGIPFRILDSKEARPVIKSYAENFAAVRRNPWTH